MTAEAAAAAQTNADNAWAEHNTALTDARTALHAAFDARKAATGITMGPQLDAAVDIALTTLTDHADALNTAKQAKDQALAHQKERDDITYTLPAPAPAAPAPKLEQGDPAAVRDWLQHATAQDVAGALDEIDSGDARVMWAETMLTWVRQDGNTADVIAVLRNSEPTTEVERPNPEWSGLNAAPVWEPQLQDEQGRADYAKNVADQVPQGSGEPAAEQALGHIGHDDPVIPAASTVATATDAAEHGHAGVADQAAHTGPRADSYPDVTGETDSEGGELADAVADKRKGK